MDFVNRKRPFRHLGRVIDTINVLLSMVVLICAAMIAINMKQNMLLFPVIFLCTGLMNMALAIKYFKRKESLKFITLMIAFLLFMVLGIISLVIVL